MALDSQNGMYCLDKITFPKHFQEQTLHLNVYRLCKQLRLELSRNRLGKWYILKGI